MLLWDVEEEGMRTGEGSVAVNRATVFTTSLKHSLNCKLRGGTLEQLQENST